MRTCKEEATRWVHRFAAGGAAYAALPLPVSTSVGLAGLEATMAGKIGKIYGEPMDSVTKILASGSFLVMGRGLKWLAIQGTMFIPVLGIPIRMGIAGVAIEALGHSLVLHFERLHPGKTFEEKKREDE
jgi:uncharacterized protein (DUF697 family)